VTFFLGIDGGGTKTRCVLGDDDQVLGMGTGSGCSILRVGEACARDSLAAAIHEACVSAGVSPHQISLIRLATPTTNDERLKTVLDGVSGFIYYVAVAGVTGAKAAVADHVRAAVERLKRATSLPIAVGFGVREPEAARAIALTADAVVVGSAIVDEIANSGKPEAVERVLRKVKQLSDAVHAARDLEGHSR